MDTLLTETWTADSFLAWEDKQDSKHEFDGRDVLAMSGETIAHQLIVMNLCLVLRAKLLGSSFEALQEIRLRTQLSVRYPDVVICAAPLEQTTRTLMDAFAIFEVLSDDTATTDRVAKLNEYATLPSLRSYVLLEQTAVAATVLQREPGGPWIASAQAGGELGLAHLDLILPMADLYRGLTFKD